MTQSDFPIGSQVSYQCAGMDEPEYGTVVAHAEIEAYIFVRFSEELQAKFTPHMYCKPGKHTSWWKQGEDGKWQSSRFEKGDPDH